MTNKKITTALLSYGMSGEVFHGPLLEVHPGFEITSVWHRNPNKSPVHRYPVVTTKEEIFNDDTIELVIVNTPNETHFPYAMEALKAGKHVLVEKPFTVKTKEADELIAEAKRQNKILTVFQNRRWDGDFLTVQNVIRQNQVGKLVEFEAHYDRFRNYIEPGTWKEVASSGTGILYNLGSHLLDQVIFLFGMPDYADARVGIQRIGGKVDDYYDIRLEYKDFLVIVKSSYLVKEQGPRYMIHGTEGSFIKHGLDVQEQALKEKKVPGVPGWGSEGEEGWGTLNTTSYNGPVETIPGNYLLFYDALYDAIRNGKQLPVKAEEAREVIRLIEACYESSRTKRAIKLSHH